MSQNGCGRYGQSGGCHPGVQGEDPDGQRTLTSWLNSAQMGVCSRPREEESSVYTICQCGGFVVICSQILISRLFSKYRNNKNSCCSTRQNFFFFLLKIYLFASNIMVTGSAIEAYPIYCTSSVMC